MSEEQFMNTKDVIGRIFKDPGNKWEFTGFGRSMRACRPNNDARGRHPVRHCRIEQKINMASSLRESCDERGSGSLPRFGDTPSTRLLIAMHEQHKESMYPSTDSK